MWRRLASAALVATAAVLPFELRATLPAGPLRLSSVELFVYATLALWAMARVAAARQSWRALVDLRRWPLPLAAAAALALVLLVSAAGAPQFRAAAVKFALRSCGGILLGVAAADLLRAPATMRRTLTALVAGALVAAVAAIAETRLPSVAPLLRPFHDQTFHALGQVRGSGPLQFPNIAAMVMEAAVPLALALGATAPAARRAMPAGIAAAAVLLAGVVSTASRAGLVTGALAVVAMAPWLRRAAAPRRADLIVAGAGLALLAGLVAVNAPLAARLRLWDEGQWYRAAVTDGPSFSRLQLWRAALAAFRDRPLLGVGPDNFRHLYAGYLRLTSADDRWHANCLYLETLADLGVVGVAAGAALILALAGAARRATGLLAVGVAVALGTFLLHGTLDYFFEFTPTYSMFWLLAGALTALGPVTPEMTS